MKLGAFLKQYLKQSLQAFKHPKQMLPTIILTVVWIILGILQVKLRENLPMKVLNFITYAQGGLYGGVVSAIGGILGKIVVAGFVNALIVPLFMGKKPFKGLGNGFKELGKSLSLQSRQALAPFLKGLGSALLLYGLSNITGRMENSMAGIMAAVSLALAMGKKNGFLWNFACSYAQSVTKGKTPDYTGVLRALTGMTLGFALGVGMHAAGIGLVGIVGIVALALGWMLGWGSKKEAATAMVLIALTLVPAPKAQAAKPNAWVLVGKETTVSQPSLIYEHDGGGIRNIAGDITHYSFLTVSPAYNTAITIEGTVSGLQGQYKDGETINGTYSFSYSGRDPEAIENGKSTRLCLRMWYNAEHLEKLGLKIIDQWAYHGVGLTNHPGSGEYSFTLPERTEDSIFPVKDDIYIVYELTIDTIGNGEIYLTTTYHFQWNGKPMKEEAGEGVVEEAVEEVEDALVEESLEEEATAEALVNLVKEWLKEQGEDVHTDEAETVIRDIVAGILAGGAAAAAAGGAAGGGAGGGPFGGDFPGGGEGPESGKTEEEKEWERQMEEYKKWEKSKFDKYTRKNPDGTINVTDPSTGKTSVFYPKEGGGYENENGTTYSDNDLANWLDDRERNSEYYNENAATAEKNLEDWRKRNEELKDKDREAYNKAKAERAQQNKKEDYENMLRDKYLNGGKFDAKAIKTAILKERMAANKEYADAIEWENRMDELINQTQLVQDTCDALINVGANYVDPGGSLIQDVYSLAKGAAARGADAAARGKSWKEIGKSAGAGLVEGSIDVLKNHVDDMVDFVGDKLPSSITDAVGETAKEVISETVSNVGTVFYAGTKQVVSSALDGKTPAEIVKDVKETCTKEVINIGIGKVVEKVGEKVVTLTAKGVTKFGVYKGDGGVLAETIIESTETAVGAMSDVWTETQGNKVTDLVYENTGDVIKDVSDKAKSIKSTLRDRARKKYGEKPSEKK